MASPSDYWSAAIAILFPLADIYRQSAGQKKTKYTTIARPKPIAPSRSHWARVMLSPHHRRWSSARPMPLNAKITRGKE
jgi:hypothetical protein